MGDRLERLGIRSVARACLNAWKEKQDYSVGVNSKSKGSGDRGSESAASPLYCFALDMHCEAHGEQVGTPIGAKLMGQQSSFEIRQLRA